MLISTKSETELLQRAEEISRRSNCTKRSVGAVIAKDGRVLAHGWNGTILPGQDCVSAACPRCSDGGNLGEGYDQCICVHAEQRAIAAAAKAGIGVEDATLYVTLRPCLPCLLLALEAGISAIVYTVDWRYQLDILETAYEKHATRFRRFQNVSPWGSENAIANSASVDS